MPKPGLVARGSRVLPALVILAALAALGGAPRSAEAQPKLLRWHNALESAAEAARSSGKPIFVVFRCVR